MIRVLVADDNAIIRRGVTSLLADADDIDVVAEAADGKEAIAAAREHRPDVILLDVRMPVMDGLTAAGPLSEVGKVMMLTYSEADEQVTAAIRAGASGYLVHGRFEPDELHTRIRELAAGNAVLSPAVAPAVFAALRRAPVTTTSGGDELTPREAEIMDRISQGRTNREIADEFVLSEKTVKNHVNRIYGKLGAHSRTHATALWLGSDRRA
ncbi:MAG TPA: response regulator transcription factor [Solirubrobacteraceae bacterium]|nr:response regulator transcription factor [Solirubrobacteraceae bacterium]